MGSGGRRPAPPGGGDALEQGRVVAAHGRHVVVETDSGRRVHCHARGKRSELVVGDRVYYRTVADLREALRAAGGENSKITDRRRK